MYMTGALTAGRRLIAYPQDTSGVRNLTGSSEPATGVTTVGPAARRSPRRRLRLRAASYPRSIQICMDRGPRVRLPNAAHTSRPWRIHELAPDFRLEDVWALPTPGRPDAVGDSVEGRGAARLGTPGQQPRLGAADAPRPIAGGSARGPIWSGLRRGALQLAVPARR